MGEVLKILDFLEKKHYAHYCWVDSMLYFSPDYSWSYINSLEDGHHYSLLFPEKA